MPPAFLFPNPKPWSVSNFIEYRPHLVNFLRKEVVPHIRSDECRRILINAPVKSGKREIAECLSMFDNTSDSKTGHMFISAWHRKADDDQRDELSKHYLHVFSIINKKEKDRCLEFIQRTLDEGKNLVIHYDECDHGSGARQMMSNVWRRIRDNEKIKTIMYSATHEEVLFSNEIDGEYDEDYEDMLDEFQHKGVVVHYTPPDGYCGAKKFLEERLVHNAKRFILKNADGSIELSEQGKQIVHELRENMKTEEGKRRNVIVLRLSSSEKNKKRGTKKEEKKDIYQFLAHVANIPELNEFSIFVDKAEIDDASIRNNQRILCNNIAWSREAYWEALTTTNPVLIAIDQTCSRSTEWACHDRVFAYHDYRTSFTYSVLAQAQLRIAHYSQKYGGFQRIRLYVHKPTIELAAGLITYGEYLNPVYIKQKVRSANEYRIKHKNNNTVHPEFPGEYTESIANDILSGLGCLEVPKLSDRLTGKIKPTVKIDGGFIACEMDTFDVAVRPIIQGLNPTLNFRTPFLKAEEMHAELGFWPGYIRGWRRLDYDTQVKNEKWGFSLRDLQSPQDRRHIRLSICYQNGILGVGYRIPVGQDLSNNVSTHKSQYKS